MEDLFSDPIIDPDFDSVFKVDNNGVVTCLQSKGIWRLCRVSCYYANSKDKPPGMEPQRCYLWLPKDMAVRGKSYRFGRTKEWLRRNTKYKGFEEGESIRILEVIQ